MKKGILFAAIPIIIFVIAIFLIKRDDKPEVHVLKESVRVGYETVPAEYDVTASPAFRWTHGGHEGWMVVSGFLLFIVAGVYVYTVDVQEKDHNWFILIFLWVMGGMLILGKYSFKYYSEKYSKRVSQEQYDAAKDDLNKLFE